MLCAKHEVSKENIQIKHLKVWQPKARGFKLHLVINDKGEILNFVITQANTDDRQPLKDTCTERSGVKNFII